MLPDGYSLDNLRRAVRNPGLFIDEFKRQINHVHEAYNSYQYEATEVVAEDWDNLILLDACRYDAFSDCHSLDGRLESRISSGSTSKEFTRQNFAGRDLHDTVIVTANPYIGLVDDDVFHAVVTLLDEWDPDAQTVHPSTVVDAAQDVHETYPQKRLIVHFMQPHQPYLGEKAAEIKAEIESYRGEYVGWNNQVRQSFDHGVDSFDGINQLETPAVPELDVTVGDVWEAYCETLDIALAHTDELLSSLNGKSVISADHGELIGEKPYVLSEPTYGHPAGKWTSQLRVVPWFVVEAEERRTVTAEPPTRYDDLEDDDELDSKLEALGYL